MQYYIVGKIENNKNISPDVPDSVSYICHYEEATQTFLIKTSDVIIEAEECLDLEAECLKRGISYDDVTTEWAIEGVR